MIKTAAIKRGGEDSLGFSFLDYAAPLVFEFMQHFAAPQNYQGTQSRVHVILKALGTSPSEPFWFFFPLCGHKRMQWNASQTLKALQTQAFYFSHFVKQIDQIFNIIQRIGKRL